MSPHGIPFVVSLLVALAVVFFVDRLLRPSLRQLLEEITGLPAATEFYLRSLVIVLVFVAASASFNSVHTDIKAGSRFMEYVWAEASDLQNVMQGIFGVLLGYVALITILVAALRRRQP
jgi:hypothetical protein